MKQQLFLYVVISFFMGVLVGTFAAVNAVNNNKTGMMQMMGIGRSAARQGSALDAHFIEQMIPHHQDALTMANSALKRAKREEVKALATDIISAQQKEIDQMRTWYKDWFGRDLPAGDEVMDQHGMMDDSGMHMGMMGNNTDSVRLDNAEDFDKAFIEGMIPHHQMAVMMASMLKQGTDRPEMKRLADDIITAQTAEIERMRSWYAEWYK